MGFEPTTSTLARSHSTTELPPRCRSKRGTEAALKNATHGSVLTAEVPLVRFDNKFQKSISIENPSLRM